MTVSPYCTEAQAAELDEQANEILKKQTIAEKINAKKSPAVRVPGPLQHWAAPNAERPVEIQSSSADGEQANEAVAVVEGEGGAADAGGHEQQQVTNISASCCVM